VKVKMLLGMSNVVSLITHKPHTPIFGLLGGGGGEITPCSHVFLEKPTVTQLLKNSATFYATGGFITMFTRDCH
jgi:hypothetical protein